MHSHTERDQHVRMQTEREESSVEVKKLGVCCHKPKKAWGSQKLEGAKQAHPLGGPPFL